MRDGLAIFVGPGRVPVFFDNEGVSEVIGDLSGRGAETAYYDPHIPVIAPTREHGNWEGFKSVAWNFETIKGFDAVLICTAHAGVNYGELARWSSCIIDTRNAMWGIEVKPGQVWKA